LTLFCVRDTLPADAIFQMMGLILPALADFQGRINHRISPGAPGAKFPEGIA
jgi:hypothetical protein